MDEWTPATKDEVLRAVRAETSEYDIGPWQHMLIDPSKRGVERFGSVEDAFVVARGPDRVVYYDDIEDEFGTATETEKILIDYRSYGPLLVALKELSLIHI